MTHSDAVKLALIGCGWIGGTHMQGYRDLYQRGCRDFEVSACCDVLPAKAEAYADEIAAFQGSRPAVFSDVDELIASSAAEAADVCLPHWLHHTIGLRLLAGGMHTMIEKPLGLTVKASQRLIAAAEEAGLVLATAENIRRYPTARACAWAINERRLIGDMRLVTVHAVADEPFDYAKPLFKWRGIKLLTGGGMIMDSGAHFADMVQVLFGAVDTVRCTMATYDARVIENAPVLGDVPADVEDTWHALIRFKSGLDVTWTYSRSFPGANLRFANYHGSSGTMCDLGFPFHPFQGGGAATLADGSEIDSDAIVAEYMASLSQEQRERLFPYGTDDGFAIEVWDFVDAIRNDRKPEMDGHDGLRAKALSIACYEAATSGEAVSFDGVLSGAIDAYQRPINDYWRI